MRAIWVDGIMRRPSVGLAVWEPLDPRSEWRCRGRVAWVSQGGSSKGHPYRMLPTQLDITPEPTSGAIQRVHLLGVFALHASPEEEPSGTVGAVATFDLAGEVPWTVELVAGKHYSDARQLEPVDLRPGDGTNLRTVGTCELDGETYRVDCLTIDVPIGKRVQSLKFQDRGASSSFMIFDVTFEATLVRTCPFSAKARGVTLEDLGAAVRVGDRRKFNQGLSQLIDGIRRMEASLDDARGSALLYLAVVCAAQLEAGTQKPLHRFQLDAAREMEKASTAEDVVRVVTELTHELLGDLVAEPTNETDALMNRALQILERGFARDLSDEEVAKQLGLSVSHFRFLFKQVTGQAFGRYLMALRLEKARAMLYDQDLTVGEVAHAVGFLSAAHFSRAFTKRFGVAPSAVKHAHR